MGTVPLAFTRRTPEELLDRALAFHASMSARRTVRDFAPDPVPRAVIEACLRTAGTAPSGAHQQPWHFVAVSEPALKHRIREGAEAEERAFYGGRAPAEWLAAVAPFGTGADKPFLDVAPWLIAVFARPYDLAADGRRVKHYYVQESVGIATGLLIAALHEAGLATLTHTPSPMRFLNGILGRPFHERPFVLLVTGFAAPGARVPDLRRKPLDEIASFRD
jgi:nitroreductase